jgi:hypothetical protein
MSQSYALYDLLSNNKEGVPYESSAAMLAAQTSPVHPMMNVDYQKEVSTFLILVLLF